MSKFNTTRTRTAVSSPIVTESAPSGFTFEGGDGFKRSVKSELFLLSVSNMVGESTFYEPGGKRDDRYSQLVRAATREDPEWTARLLRWLRTEANMRSAALVGAAEFVQARREDGLPGMDRRVVDSVLQRADEPGEFLAYWLATYGKPIPTSVKKGLSDALWRLYDERAFLKWDSGTRGVRFADVIDLVRPTGSLKDTKSKPIVGTWRADLYEYILDDRHGNAQAIPEALSTLSARSVLMATDPEIRRSLLDPVTLAAAGMTWESLAGWLQGPMDAQAWETVIPSMGYMALLRNLRNFDEAGVSDEATEAVAAKLADPDRVARSRQFPFRFLSAYENAPSLRWGYALEKALQASLRNLPSLPGRSLILVDTSASMTNGGYSAKSKVTPAKAAALFGVALAAKGEQVDIHGFADGVFRHELPKGASVLSEVKRFLGRIGEVGHGTNMVGAAQSTYSGHDRVFLISDMQTLSGSYGRGVGEVIPKNVPVYGFNLQGYEHAAMATGSGNRHEFGGLTDATFRSVPLLEAGRNADWPF